MPADVPATADLHRPLPRDRQFDRTPHGTVSVVPEPRRAGCPVPVRVRAAAARLDGIQPVALRFCGTDVRSPKIHDAAADQRRAGRSTKDDELHDDPDGRDVLSRPVGTLPVLHRDQHLEYDGTLALGTEG